MIETIASYVALGWAALLFLTVAFAFYQAIVRTRREGSLPGESINWIVTATSLLVFVMGGLGVAQFAEVVEAARYALTALIPVSLGPWLLYRGAKAVKGKAVKGKGVKADE